MADVITLTPQPVRVTAASTRQAVYAALDVAGYDILDLQALITVEGTMGASTQVLNLLTGMQTIDEQGWITAASNFPTASGTGQQVIRVTAQAGFLRYIRWEVGSLGGASAVTIFIRGMGRSYR